MSKKIKYLYLLTNNETNERYIDCAEYNGLDVNEDTYKSDIPLRKVFTFYNKSSYDKKVLHVLDERDSLFEKIEEFSKLYNAKSLYNLSTKIEPKIVKKAVVCLNNMRKYDSINTVRKVRGLSEGSLYKALEKSPNEPAVFGVDSNKSLLFWMYYDEFLKREDLNDEQKRKSYIKKVNRFEKKHNPQKFNKKVAPESDKYVFNEDGSVSSKTYKKRIICLNTKKRFNSLKDAASYYNLDKSHISHACSEERRSCGKDENGNKLYWMYEEDFKKDPRSSSEIIEYRNNLFEELKKTRGKQLNDNKNPKSYCKEVICLNNMKVYDSLKEIEETFGINVGIYLRKGKVAHFSCGSDKNGIAYQWMYYEKYLEKIENGEEVKFDPNLKIATASKKKKKVICLNTGEVFDSMSDASNAYSASVLNALYNNMIGPKTCGVDKNGVINQWMYYDKYLKKIKNGEEVKFDPNLKESNFHLNERNKKSGKKLICLNDMKTYDSIKKVEEELGIYIKHYLYKGITTPKTCGLDKDGNFNKWMYYDKYLEEIENGKDFSIDKNLNPDKKRA